MTHLNERGISRLLLLAGGVLVGAFILGGLWAANRQSRNSSNQSSEHFLTIKEWGVKMPLSAGNRDMYYSLIDYHGELGQGARLYSRDFDDLKNKDGVPCQDQDYPLFVISRVTASRGLQMNNPNLPEYEPRGGPYKTHSFQSDYAFGGAHDEKIVPPCLHVKARTSDERHKDEDVTRVYEAKVEALRSSYLQLQAAPTQPTPK